MQQQYGFAPAPKTKFAYLSPMPCLIHPQKPSWQLNSSEDYVAIEKYHYTFFISERHFITLLVVATPADESRVP